MPQIFNDVACTVCGCVCDDLQVTVDGDHIVHVERACSLAQPRFEALSKPLTRPVAIVDGQPTTVAQAIDRATEILRASRAPLIWGLARSSTPGQRAAVALAEQIGAIIDTTTSCHPSSTLAFQAVGQSTCSLGEVRNRADLVIYWRADPATSHPRHMERYSADAMGMFTPRGRADRTIVAIDSKPTETSRLGDLFIEIPDGSDLEVVGALRQFLELGEPAEGIESNGNEQLQQLVQKMKSCQYGALFVGAGRGDGVQATLESIVELVRELNKFTRFTVHFMPSSGGLTRAENVLCWQTGFPFAINFANGYPQYDPVAFCANSLLERGAVDACVLVGSEDVAKLSSVAQQALAQLPIIALDSPIADSPITPATIQFTTTIYGIHTPGTAYRMDGIPIPLRQLMPSQYPTDEHVLSEIATRLKASTPA